MKNIKLIYLYNYILGAPLVRKGVSLLQLQRATDLRKRLNFLPYSLKQTFFSLASSLLKVKQHTSYFPVHSFTHKHTRRTGPVTTGNRESQNYSSTETPVSSPTKQITVCVYLTLLSGVNKIVHCAGHIGKHSC